MEKEKQPKSPLINKWRNYMVYSPHNGVIFSLKLKGTLIQSTIQINFGKHDAE
jgi:hypothetical protein